MVLCFYKLHPKDRWEYEDIGYRTGWVNIAQLPLIFLLAGKNNLIGYLTGTSYEKLNWLHRWAARCLLLTATIHMGYWFTDWWPYGGYVNQMIKTDQQANRGFIAWILLLWIVFSSVAPIRGWRYEIFVIQHLVSFTAFIVFVYLHAFPETRKWIWICVAFFFFDRFVRGALMLYTNISFFHPKQRREGTMSGLWACRAEFTPLPHDTTKITIKNPPISWKPGQHVFVSCHSIVPLQAHPFTIASIPQDGEMTFVLRAQKGGTRRFFHHAQKMQRLPIETASGGIQVKTVAIQGPYGCIRPLRQFDSVVFFAGSTGATYTVPLLRDLIQEWRAEPGQKGGLFAAPGGAVTRHIRFVWVVKARGQLEWFARHLSLVVEDVNFLKEAGRDVLVDISVYVTCDETFTEEHKFTLSGEKAPKSATRGKDEHGRVEEIDEKSDIEDKKTSDIEVSELPSRTPVTDNTEVQVPKSCGPNGTCCCKTTIANEPTSSEDAINCCCCGPSNRPNPSSASSITSSSAPSTTKPLLHPSISVLAGRPHPRTIIRKVLEQALGESAVVVCGPQGLVDDVRQSVVRLSDERAVHKGTGAQGVYLHVEGFCY
jgi:NAD(P)H-flavin reductase